jgi:hypothetical protein
MNLIADILQSENMLTYISLTIAIYHIAKQTF